MTRPDLAAVAASQFERRRAWLRRQVAAGAIAPAAANDRARPWRGAASGTVTLPLARLHATETAAMAKPGRRTRKRSK